MHNRQIRKGCIDIWNAFMVEGAVFDYCDIPFCPTTATRIPKNLISYIEAKSICNKEFSSGNKDFHHDAFVHTYIDDQKFDGSKSGIWNNPNEVLKILQHFEGVITFDFSTYADFPYPLKLWNTYRMRAFGYWLSQSGIKIINNVRWGGPETWDYSFSGLPNNSMFFIGTVGSGLKSKENWEIFDAGLMELVNRKNPYALLVYGSDNYPIFSLLRSRGIEVIGYKSDTCRVYERGKKHE